MEFHRRRSTKNFLPGLPADFAAQFPDARVPSERVIRDLHKKFLALGRINNKNSKSSPGVTHSGRPKTSTCNQRRYSVCSLVVPRLEEAILTPVLKKNFKRPLILGQEGHNYPPKHSNLSYDQFGVRLEQSDTAPPLLPPGWRDTDSFSWICSVFNSSISRRS